MKTEAAIDPAAIAALDFTPTCQVEHWFIFVPEQVKPACGKPADYLADVHNFHTCRSVEKFICAECLPAFRAPCSSCQAARLTNVRALRGSSAL